MQEGQALATTEMTEAIQSLTARMEALGVKMEDLTVAMWASQLRQTQTAGPMTPEVQRESEGPHGEDEDLLPL